MTAFFSKAAPELGGSEKRAMTGLPFAFLSHSVSEWVAGALDTIKTIAISKSNGDD